MASSTCVLSFNPPNLFPRLAGGMQGCAMRGHFGASVSPAPPASRAKPSRAFRRRAGELARNAMGQLLPSSEAAATFGDLEAARGWAGLWARHGGPPRGDHWKRRQRRHHRVLVEGCVVQRRTARRSRRRARSRASSRLWRRPLYSAGRAPVVCTSGIRMWIRMRLPPAAPVAEPAGGAARTAAGAHPQGQKFPLPSAQRTRAKSTTPTPTWTTTFAAIEQRRGGPAREAAMPTADQIAGMHVRALVQGDAPSADFSTPTLFGRQLQKHLRTRSWVMAPDRKWMYSEVPGPDGRPSLRAWPPRGGLRSVDAQTPLRASAGMPARAPAESRAPRRRLDQRLFPWPRPPEEEASAVRRGAWSWTWGCSAVTPSAPMHPQSQSGAGRIGGCPTEVARTFAVGCRVRMDLGQSAASLWHPGHGRRRPIAMQLGTAILSRRRRLGRRGREAAGE